ncbi:hypothetical protein E8E12_003180 [Didymella heteroderae]|uniref:DUF7607 domain-containing protein n=1 Tax=Didymella heteroderae TaxID=1769908 RepID=A0A9P4WM78_9PLEO|nr:hypothetical protein E8E12_003180 [Didymella heteroderae]
MSVPTPTTRVQSFQLDRDCPAAKSPTAVIPDAEGRKRRRITPIESIPTPAVGQDAGSTQGLSLLSSAQPVNWDHLVKWETEDDSIAGDIEDEEYYSDGSDESPGAVEDTVEDGEEGDDMQSMSPAPIPSRLGSDLVTEIINGCIEKFAEAWKPGKDETRHKDEAGQTEVPVVYDPLQLWTDAENAGVREELAEKYEEEAKYYQQRLDILCEEIFKDPGHTEAGIRMVGICPVSTDDESSESGAHGFSNAEPFALERSGQAQRPQPLSQVIDLDTPSASDCSDDEDTPHSNIPTMPLSIEHRNDSGLVTESRSLPSDPTIVDTIEAISTVAEPTPKVVRPQPLLGDAPEHASIVSRSPDPAIFCDYLNTVLNTTFSLEALSKPTQPSQAEIIEISDDDEPPAPSVNRRKANIDRSGSAHKGEPIVLD